MAFHFRPFPGLTIATLLAVALLSGLGVWQLQRLKQKEALIASVAAHMSGPAISFDQARALPPGQAQYHRVRLSGRFENAREIFTFATAAGGQAGYHVLTPFRLDDGRLVMVDRGFVPMVGERPGHHSVIEGDTTLTAICRPSEAPNLFTPAPDQTRRLWFVRDVAAIARAQGLVLSAPVLLEAEKQGAGFPQGGQTVVNFPNNHLQYAMTWFGLAAGLLAVYLAYHVSRGRLRWT